MRLLRKISKRNSINEQIRKFFFGKHLDLNLLIYRKNLYFLPVQHRNKQAKTKDLRLGKKFERGIPEDVFGTKIMEYTVEIPAITFDATLLFLETDPEKLSTLQSEEERQDAAQRSVWEEILEAKEFRALAFTQRCEWPMTLILHPSTYPGVDWQLSRFDYEGIPIAHSDFSRMDMEALYKELMSYARGGVSVRIVIE